MTQALSGDGIDELWTAIERHLAYLNETGEIVQKRREAFAHQVRQLALGRLERRVDRELQRDFASGVDPYEAAAQLLARFGNDDGASAEHAARPRATVKGLT
jgi:LAO/AO transport system kinase